MAKEKSAPKVDKAVTKDKKVDKKDKKDKPAAVSPAKPVAAAAAPKKEKEKKKKEEPKKVAPPPKKVDSSSDESESEDEKPKAAQVKPSPTKKPAAAADSSDDDSSDEEPAPKKAAPATIPKKSVAATTQKAAPAKKAESSDEDSDESSEDEKPAPAPKKTAPAPAPKAAAPKAAAKKPETSSSEEESSDDEDVEMADATKPTTESDSDSSDEEDEKPAAKKPAPVANGKANGKAPAAAKDSDDSESDSDDDSDSSDDSDEEMADAAPVTNGKRKAPADDAAPAKKVKLANGTAAPVPADAGSDEITSIFVGRLSWNIDDAWLAQEFAECGEVVSATVAMDRNTGKSRGFGHVHFSTTAAVTKALELNGKEIDGRQINVDRGRPPATGADKAANRAKAFNDKVSEPSATLFVGSLSWNADEDMVWQFFSEHGGNVKSVRLPTDRDTGKPKGFGYVEFEDIESAKKAFESASGQELDGRALRLDYSQPREPGGGGGGFDGGRGRGRGGFGDRGGRGGFGGRVDFVVESLPSMLRAALGAAVDQSHSDLTDHAIEKIVACVLADVEERIMTDFLALIPAASGQDNSDIAACFRDASGELLPAVQRVLSGTTVSLALVDPSSRVHVFSVGDCDAMLCRPLDSAAEDWDCQVISFEHSCSNPDEQARIQAEHPDEPECVSIAGVPRLLGILVLSRALGNVYFNLPPHLLALVAEVADWLKLESFGSRFKSPPYLSSVPQATHADTGPQDLLIVASDGLRRLMGRTHPEVASDPALMGRLCASAAAKAKAAGRNTAAEILWEAMGGDSDENLCEAALAGDLRGPVDDTSILVVPLA
ncbi:Serine/threonine protein phosphatase 2C [Mycena chlorophos]|uniref:Serine/threonine protein phosphatase 2C n=1 Tax=Mycena chlorophos TaxID=658473 RepID=A0A8H6WGR1_MYCCL|nr:Serine/threonine protein phosphatase 2C [Mycena chlorophos]